ncbi:MAG: hypothetical protein OXT67_11580 [Zetaproteobacteria bacterium]|nr:hypothetical protein [Zetaproteobacteria bacterium]
MKVICNQDKGTAVPAEIRGADFSTETRFSVTIGKTYIVYAMGQRVGSSLLEYLVCDELGTPFYCPSHLFSIIDSSLPSNWGYSEWIQPGFHYRIWGYKEILDYDHNEGLLERRKPDMEVFAKAKKGIDDCTWIEGELEVLARLSYINELPTIDHLIDRRVKSSSSLKTLFLGTNQLSHTKGKAGDFQTVSVVLNNGEIEGECMLLVKDDKIEGIEVFLFDNSIPRVIRNIKPKIQNP